MLVDGQTDIQSLQYTHTCIHIHTKSETNSSSSFVSRRTWDDGRSMLLSPLWLPRNIPSTQSLVPMLVMSDPVEKVNSCSAGDSGLRLVGADDLLGLVGADVLLGPVCVVVLWWSLTATAQLEVRGCECTCLREWESERKKGERERDQRLNIGSHQTQKLINEDYYTIHYLVRNQSLTLPYSCMYTLHVYM